MNSVRGGILADDLLFLAACIGKQLNEAFIQFAAAGDFLYFQVQFTHLLRMLGIAEDKTFLVNDVAVAGLKQLNLGAYLAEAVKRNRTEDDTVKPAVVHNRNGKNRGKLTGAGTHAGGSLICFAAGLYRFEIVAAGTVNSLPGSIDPFSVGIQPHQRIHLRHESLCLYKGLCLLLHSTGLKHRQDSQLLHVRLYKRHFGFNPDCIAFTGLTGKLGGFLYQGI